MSSNLILPDLLYCTLTPISLGNAALDCDWTLQTWRNFPQVKEKCPQMWKSTSCDVTKSTMLSNRWQQRRLGAQDKPGLSSVYDTYVFLEYCSERRPSFFYSLPEPPARCCCGGPSIQSCSTKRSAPLHMYAVIYIGRAQHEICSPASIFWASIQTTSAWGRRGSPAARRTCEKKKTGDPDGEKSPSEQRKMPKCIPQAAFSLCEFCVRAAVAKQKKKEKEKCFSVWNFNVFLFFLKSL